MVILVYIRFFLLYYSMTSVHLQHTYTMHEIITKTLQENCIGDNLPMSYNISDYYAIL